MSHALIPRLALQELILANILAVITNGGTAGMFWSYVIVVAGYLLVYASLAEMASMASEVFGKSRLIDPR